MKKNPKYLHIILLWQDIYKFSSILAKKLLIWNNLYQMTCLKIRACIIFFALFKFFLAPNTNTCSGSKHGRQLQSKHGRCAISTSHPLPITISYHIILALCKNFLILTSPSWKKNLIDFSSHLVCVCIKCYYFLIYCKIAQAKTENVGRQITAHEWLKCFYCPHFSVILKFWFSPIK